MSANLPLNPRALPAVHAVLELPAAETLVAEHGRPPVVNAIRAALADLRNAMDNDGSLDLSACLPESVLNAAAGRLRHDSSPRLKRVVNATGIILHTGLGRAFMPPSAIEAIVSAIGYCNVQLDLQSGARIKREASIRDLVEALTGAEETLLVNNNAAATMLVLKALASGKEVIISRGELVEIGGSFRLPDIMNQSGAVMREVGTTNKTHLRDYATAIHPEKTALLLKVHRSNYEIRGFTHEVELGELATLGRERGITVVDDLGCGALVPLERFGLPHERTMRESLATGADIVLSSTDKLIGGPQGGLIAGRKSLLDAVRADSLYRPLRVCKMTLAALEATLRLFEAPERLPLVHPLYHMLARRPDELQKQAAGLAQQITAAQPGWDVGVVEEISRLGGGSLPGTELPSYAIRIVSPSQSSPDTAAALRGAATPVVSHIRDGAVHLNMRTVSPAEAPAIVDAIKQCAP